MGVFHVFKIEQMVPNRDFNWSYFLNISDCMVSSNSLICSAKLIADNDFYKYKSS